MRVRARAISVSSSRSLTRTASTHRTMVVAAVGASCRVASERGKEEDKRTRSSHTARVRESRISNALFVKQVFRLLNSASSSLLGLARSSLWTDLQPCSVKQFKYRHGALPQLEHPHPTLTRAWWPLALFGESVELLSGRWRYSVKVMLRRSRARVDAGCPRVCVDAAPSKRVHTKNIIVAKCPRVQVPKCPSAQMPKCQASKKLGKTNP